MGSTLTKSILAALLSLCMIFLCSCSILDADPVVLSDEEVEKLTESAETDDELLLSSYTSKTPSSNNGVWTITHPDGQTPRLENGILKSFDTLLELNPDIVGWITIPGTVIDYPVVQGTDNDFYLHHNIYGDDDKNGTLFIHYKNPFGPEYESRVTLIFGHHMRSGIMFEDLMQFDITSNPDALEFYRNSGVFTYDSLYTEGYWVVFSVMKINTLEAHGDIFRFMVSDFDDSQTAEYQAYIDEIRSRSVIDTSSVVDVTTDDRIIIMSTCSYEYDNFRTLIAARQIRPDETTFDLTKAFKAENPVMPEVWDIAY